MTYGQPRPSTSALTDAGSTWKWRNHIRPRILARDNHTCQYCGLRVGDTRVNHRGEVVPVRMTVNHRLPRELGGGDEDWNLVTCCDRCQRLAPVEGAQDGSVFKKHGLTDMRLSRLSLPNNGSSVITRDYSRRKGQE
jgi:5-methylcytosine-specific restriction endonuclease McrA